MRPFSLDRQDVIVREALDMEHGVQRAGRLVGAGVSEYYDLGLPLERLVSSVRAAYDACRAAERLAGGRDGRGEPS